MRRALRAAAGEIDRRFGWFAAPARTDEDAAIAVVEGSVVFRACSAVVAAVERAIASSRLAGRVRAATTPWLQLPHQLRLRTIGLLLVIAPIVHVALNVWRVHTPGWLWLAIPAAALLVGVLFLIGSLAPVEARRGV